MFFCILGGDALAEDVVGPALVDQDNRHEDAGGDRHDGERVGARGRVRDRQAPGRVEARDHQAREQAGEEGDGRRDDGGGAQKEAGLALAELHTQHRHDEEERGADECDGGDRLREEVGVRQRHRHAEYEEDGGDGAGLQGDFLAAQDEARLGEAQRQEGRAVEQEDEEEGEAADDRVGRQEIEEAAHVDHLLVDGQAGDEVRDGDTPEEGRHDAAEADGAVPEALPAAALLAAAQVKGHAAQNERDEHEEEREVEGGEHRGVDVREGCEERAARRDHPDFIAVPDRRDRAQDLAALLLIGGQERQQAADAVVEALEEEEACKEYCDEDEPENC